MVENHAMMMYTPFLEDNAPDGGREEEEKIMEIPVYEAEESPCRAYVIQRRTKETRISVDLCLEGGEIRISTGIGFFDHMLTAFAFYGGLGLKIEAEGDLEVDGHHTVEDTGIVLGQALNRALGDRKGLRRFASACIPMDEALCFTVLDFSNRPFLVFDADMPQPMIGTYDPCLTEEFLRALAVNSGLTLHMKCLYGKNAHHITEALFKSLGAAVKEAVQITGTGVTSTKGGAVMGTVAIVDYRVGNLKSVANALSYLGCSSCITADPAELERADAIILPGVGAFPDAADRLRTEGWTSMCWPRVRRSRCWASALGMQLLLEQGQGGAPLSRSGG